MEVGGKIQRAFVCRELRWNLLRSCGVFFGLAAKEPVFWKRISKFVEQYSQLTFLAGVQRTETSGDFTFPERCYPAKSFLAGMGKDNLQAAPVGCLSSPLNKSKLFKPAYEPGHIRRRNQHRFAELGWREWAAVVENPKNAELRSGKPGKPRGVPDVLDQRFGYKQQQSEKVYRFF